MPALLLALRPQLHQRISNPSSLLLLLLLVLLLIIPERMLRELEPVPQPNQEISGNGPLRVPMGMGRVPGGE